MGQSNTNLAPPLTKFVGREGALASIAALQAQGARLVTLLGAPGVGKTRLALRYAELHGAAFLPLGGVWFCDCSAARSAADVCAVVARTLGVRLEAEVDVQAATEDIGNALSEAGRALLVIDNLEQVAAAVGGTVEHWTRAAPEVFFVVTSRERLALGVESVVEVEPLELPSGTCSGEAVELCRIRARAVGGWADADPSDLAALVRALDGIPLAIELAAARSRVLGPKELLARLAESSDVLASPGRGDARHRTLRGALQSSWDTLSAVERDTLAQCAIFAGEWPLEAASAVVDLLPHPDSPPLLDVLSSLRDKSLLRRSAGGGFSLYVSIKEFASEKLGSGEAREALLRRHRAYVLSATRAPAELFARTGDEVARARLAAAKDELFAIQRALVTTIASDEDARDLAEATRRLELAASAEIPLDELGAMLDAGIAAAERSGDHRLLGELYIARAHGSGLRGQVGQALADLSRARALGRRLAAPLLEAWAMMMISVRERGRGRFADARAAGEEALRLLEGKDHPRLEGQCRAVMGLLFCELGEREDSRRENLRARAIFRERGDRWSEALALANLAQLSQAEGHYEEAAHGYDEALARFRDHHDLRYESRYVGYRAGLELERGDVAAARALYATSIERLAQLRTRHTEALFRACLASATAMTGRTNEALDEIDQARALLAGVEAPTIAAAVEVHRGQVDLALSRDARDAGDSERASLLADTARKRLRDAGFVRESEDVRFAVRLLERSLSGAVAEASGTPELRLTKHARAFGVSGASLVDLGRRGALRLILQALVEQHAREPDVALSGKALATVGWPGERVLPAAASTRVRVAISTLRRLGLARLLVTRDDGYLLDPEARVVHL